jgi:son of sevenless-like protein
MALLCYAKYKTLLDRQLQILVEQENQLNPLPIPPPNYPFDAADTPAHIIFDSQTTGNGQLTFTDGPSIKAATIDKLVERLTHHLYLYTNFSRIFLICYREFCTPVEFFNLLMERFSVPDLNPNYLDVNSVELQKRYKREYQQPIKLKVINVLKHWIDGYFYDFNNSDLLLSMLNDFVLRLGNHFLFFFFILLYISLFFIREIIITGCHNTPLYRLKQSRVA